jgi:ppGpp synthetase/RelA/SpoT-type nucleotidyltranferase
MNEQEYLDWSRDNGMAFGDATERLYKANSSTALLAVQAHPFFRQLESDLRAWDEMERLRTGAPLLMTLEAPQLLQKPFSSVRNKCFRKNCVSNPNFPGAPSDGWVTPVDMYSRLNDLVRGTLVCKYVDGPKLLANYLHERAGVMGLVSRFDAESREQGYYAYHFYVSVPVGVLQADLTEIEMPLQIEIQISTQLQEVMRKVTHDFYEDSRDTGLDEDGSWKWEIESNRFRAGYVSHTLHLLESIIVQLRNDSFKKKQEKAD